MDRRFEKTLVQRARRGDMAAFELLYREHAPTLLQRSIRPRVFSKSDQEDILVETFRAAIESLPGYRWTGRSFFSWLARIAANKATDLGRAQARSHRALDGFEREPREAVARPDELLLAADERAATRGRIEVVLADLNPRYVRAIELRLQRGLDREACADAMEIKLGTFDVVLLRAVRAFRKRWAERYGEEAV